MENTMIPNPAPDRESRFQDACKLAAVVAVVGLIVAAGEMAMDRLPAPVAPMAPAMADDDYRFEHFPDQPRLPATEREPHV